MKPIDWKNKKVQLAGAGAACLVAVLVLVVWWLSSHGEDYDYRQVSRGPLRVVLQESGMIQPEHRLEVTAPISGRVDSVEVENGQDVKRGQILAWMSSTDRAALMDAARASGPEEVKFWEDIYKPAPLIAPKDGMIIDTKVVPGQAVSSSRTAFVMSDRLIVEADVDETDLSLIRNGQLVEVTLDGFPDTHLSGKVFEIAHDSRTINNVTIYTVKVDFGKVPDHVRSGLSANVYFLVADKQDVLRIPTPSISVDGKVRVAKREGGGTKLRKVSTGMSDGIWTEVLSGVEEGEWVAYHAFSFKGKKPDNFSILPRFDSRTEEGDQGNDKEEKE